MAGRRKVGLEDSAAWVFNRMVDVYDARPPYPEPLVGRLSQLAGPAAALVDLGAGIGHLAVPLAQRGHQVFAVEPAAAMLAKLRSRADGLPIHCLHATAEALPLPDGSVKLALISDAMHFLDAALVGREVRRALAPGGALAIITCELADTPFMRSVVQCMQDAAPRRPRATQHTITQLAGVAGVALAETQEWEDHTPLDHPTLQRVLRSISFIGPAMNASRFAAFWQRVEAISETPVWSRRFRLQAGRRA